MAKKVPYTDLRDLPLCAAEFIRLVIKKMRYRRKVRSDVLAELAAHFEDALKDCKSEDERGQKAEQLIGKFGDPKLLGILLRRAKKRCRPLWRTAVVRAFQTAAALVVCGVIYVAWFVTGEPNISVDYVELFNRTNRPQIPNEDNAWPHYQKAIELLVEPDDRTEKNTDVWDLIEALNTQVDNMPEDERDKVERWIEQNESAWQQFAAASSRPYCYREYEVDEQNKDKWVLGILMPHLRPLADLTRLAILRSLSEADGGRPRQALETALVIVRAGSHWQDKAVLIEQLLGLAMSRIGHERILKILSTQDLSADSLEQLQHNLTGIYEEGYPLMNVEAEKFFYLDTVQQLFTDGGPGGGHLIPRRLGPLLDMCDDKYVHSEARVLMTSLLHARRKQTMTTANEVYDRLINLGEKTPYERHILDIGDEEDLKSGFSRRRYALVWELMPAVSRASELAHRSKALHEAIVAILVLRRCRLEKGHYPRRLSELLTGGYITDLPMDPYSNKPLAYQRTDDNFLLYSVGPDFEDDSGRISRDGDGNVEKWPDEGDAVFWPVPKPDNQSAAKKNEGDLK